MRAEKTVPFEIHNLDNFQDQLYQRLVVTGPSVLLYYIQFVFFGIAWPSQSVLPGIDPPAPGAALTNESSVMVKKSRHHRILDHLLTALSNPATFNSEIKAEESGI